MLDNTHHTGAAGFQMLSLLFAGGLITAVAILWNEPKWSIFVVASLIIGLITGGLSWSVLATFADGPDLVFAMAIELIAPYVLLFGLFVVAGAILVIFRGAYLRAKKRRDDAETEAELARLRKSP